MHSKLEESLALLFLSTCQASPEGFAGVKTKLVHGKQDASVDRLETIPHIRQGPPHYHRHGILQDKTAFCSLHQGF